MERIIALKDCDERDKLVFYLLPLQQFARCCDLCPPTLSPSLPIGYNHSKQPLKKGGRMFLAQQSPWSSPFTDDVKVFGWGHSYSYCFVLHFRLSVCRVLTERRMNSWFQCGHISAVKFAVKLPIYFNGWTPLTPVWVEIPAIFTWWLKRRQREIC